MCIFFKFHDKNRMQYLFTPIDCVSHQGKLQKWDTSGLIWLSPKQLVYHGKGGSMCNNISIPGWRVSVILWTSLPCVSFSPWFSFRGFITLYMYTKLLVPMLKMLWYACNLQTTPAISHLPWMSLSLDILLGLMDGHVNISMKHNPLQCLRFLTGCPCGVWCCS